MKSIFRIISIISYCLIVLAGQMIGLPLILWLIFTMFDFGNINQLFAILGMTGIVLNYTKWKHYTWVMIISFFLMLLPILNRLVQVPIKSFNYLAFQIPVVLFVITYLVLIFINIKNANYDKRLSWKKQ